MKIAISGILGKMGQVLVQSIQKDPTLTLVGGIDQVASNNVFTSFDELSESDVLIDFSHASQLSRLLAYAVQVNLPLVIATTGYTADQLRTIQEASKKIPIFFSANYSFGVSVIVQLLQQISPLLYADFDVEIIDKHHNQKVDAPSGTALLLANTIKKASTSSKTIQNGRNGKRQLGEIAIHSIRAGTIVGEHSIVFAGQDEVIEINHIAQSKSIFAYGALKASKYIVNQKPGLYGMDQLVRDTNA